LIEGTKKSPLFVQNFLDLVSKIEELANTVLETEDLFLMGVMVSGRNPLRIQVGVESDDGLDIAKCAGISRKLAAALDSEQMLQDPYNLEVSSPGLDQPLKFRRQYHKNIGRKIKVSLTGEDHKQGELLKVGESSILVNEEIVSHKSKRSKFKQKMGYRETEIPFDQILQTTVLISFKK